MITIIPASLLQASTNHPTMMKCMRPAKARACAELSPLFPLHTARYRQKNKNTLKAHCIPNANDDNIVLQGRPKKYCLCVITISIIMVTLGVVGISFLFVPTTSKQDITDETGSKTNSGILKYMNHLSILNACYVTWFRPRLLLIIWSNMYGCAMHIGK